MGSLAAGRTGGILLRRQAKLLALAATVAVLAQLGCQGSQSTLGRARRSLTLASPAWSSGAEMPLRFTCDRENISPTLSWSAPPPKTQGFVLTLSDPYWLTGSFSHWMLYDLAPETRQLSEAIPRQQQLPDGARQGQNDLGRIGYDGPCPAFGSSRRYVFHLYAIDFKLNLPPGAPHAQVERALAGHILAEGSLIAPYERH
jgi:Raf kinase inhibitor-like YbhB/YbcL family protein